MLKHILILLSCLLFLTDAEAQPYKEGTHYFRIEPAQLTNTPGKVEVVEVFSYACHACDQFEPIVQKWRQRLPATVSFSYLPAMFNPGWELFARGYYTAEALGIKDKTHKAIFNYVYKERKTLRTLEDIAKFYSSYGEKTLEQVKKAMSSFGVETKLKRAKKQVMAYQVNETPSLIINGKWRIRGGALKSQEEMLKVADYLIRQETLGLPQATPPTSVKPVLKK